MRTIEIHYKTPLKHEELLLRFEAALKSCALSTFMLTYGLQWRLDTQTKSGVYFDLFTYVKNPLLIAYFSERELSKMSNTEFIAKLQEFSYRPPSQKGLSKNPL